MNARESILRALGKHRFDTKDPQPLQEWRAIDALTCKAVALIIATGLQNHWPSAQTIVDEARALGYSPEAPRD